MSLGSDWIPDLARSSKILSKNLHVHKNIILIFIFLRPHNRHTVSSLISHRQMCRAYQALVLM